MQPDLNEFWGCVLADFWGKGDNSSLVRITVSYEGGRTELFKRCAERV